MIYKNYNIPEAIKKNLKKNKKRKFLNIQDLWNICVKCLKGIKKIQISVESNINILELKKCIHENRQLINECIKDYSLIYKGHILKKGSMRENGLNNGDTIHLIIKPKQGFFSSSTRSKAIRSDAIHQLKDPTKMINDYKMNYSSILSTFQDSISSERNDKKKSFHAFLFDELRTRINLLESDTRRLIKRKINKGFLRHVQPWSIEQVKLLKMVRNIYGSVNDNSTFLLRDVVCSFKTERVEDLERFNSQTIKKAVAIRRLGRILLELYNLLRRFSLKEIYSLKKQQNSRFNIFTECLPQYSAKGLCLNAQIQMNNNYESGFTFLRDIFNQFIIQRLNVHMEDLCYPLKRNPFFILSREFSNFIFNSLHIIKNNY